MTHLKSELVPVFALYYSGGTMRVRSGGAIAGILVAVLSAFSAVANGAFPAKPLGRSQVMVWMDFGAESPRVITLINRAGIGFQPSASYLSLLTSLGASPDLISSLTQVQPRGEQAYLPIGGHHPYRDHGGDLSGKRVPPLRRPRLSLLEQPQRSKPWNEA